LNQDVFVVDIKRIVICIFLFVFSQYLVRLSFYIVSLKSFASPTLSPLLFLILTLNHILCLPLDRGSLNDYRNINHTSISIRTFLAFLMQ
jgi:hypothetical protein